MCKDKSQQLASSGADADQGWLQDPENTGKRRKIELSCPLAAPVNVVTPHITVVTPTAWRATAPHQAHAAPAVVTAHLTETDVTVPYAGAGVLACIDGNVSLYTDALCTNPIPPGLSYAQLTQGPPHYVAYARGDAVGLANLTLTLTPGGANVVVSPPATAAVSVEPINVVTPHLEVREANGWFGGADPDPASFEVRLEQSQNTPAHSLRASLTWSAPTTKLFVKQDCSDTGVPDNSPVVITLAARDARALLYANGTAAADVTVTYDAHDPGVPGIRVLPAATGILHLAPVNVVTPHLEVVEATGWASGSPPVPAEIRLWVDESENAPAHSQKASLSWGGDPIRLHPDQGCTDTSVPAIKPLVMALAKGHKGSLFAAGKAVGDVELTLTAVDDKVRGVEVRPAATGTLTIKAANVVTPRIQVIEAEIYRDRTSDAHFVPARLQVSLVESTGDPAYDGTGTLSADAGQLEFFTDAACQNALAQPISAVDLSGGKEVYARALALGNEGLTLTLTPKVDGRLVIQGPDTAALTVEPINVVTPHVEVVEGTGWLGGVGVQPAVVNIWLSQSEAAPLHSGEATFTWGTTEVDFHGAPDCSDGRYPKNNPLLCNVEARGGKSRAHVKGLAEGAVTLTLAAKDNAQKGVRIMPAETGNLVIKTVNVVTPHIDAEYDVVLCDPGYPGNAHLADPTRVELHLHETLPGEVYGKDATLEWDHARVAVFTDAGCTTALADPKLPSAEIAGGNRKLLYLKGTAPGLWDLKLVPEASPGPGVRVMADAVKQLGVVRLDLALHRDAAASAPGLITPPASKVAVGRVLHMQDGVKHGRAKIEVSITDAEWPAGCDEYKVVLSKASASGAVDLFTADTGGGALGARVEIRKADLAGGARTYWVEGTTVTDALRDARVHLGLDRPGGGIAHAAKSNGDWAALTVVEIEWVTPNGADVRQYVNVPAAPLQPTFGPTYRAKAKLTKPLAGIKLMFKLAAHAANIADRPASRAFNAAAAPVAVDTVAPGPGPGGEAEADLALTLYGGDQFQATAYLDEDATLGAVNPATSPNHVVVWRGINVQYATMVNPTGGHYADALAAGGFVPGFAAQFIEVLQDPTVLHPAAMHAVGSNFTAWMAGYRGGPMPNLGIHICFAYRVGGPPVPLTLGPFTPAGLVTTDWVDGAVFDLDPLKPWFQSMEWWDSTTPLARNALNNAMVSLAEVGGRYQLTLDLTTMGAPNPTTMFEIKLTGHTVWSGASSGSMIVMSEHSINSTGAAQAACTHLLLHEVGHSLGLASRVQGNAAGVTYGDYHAPQHCNSNGNGCVMYYLTTPANHTFCAQCVNALRARDYAATPINGDTTGF